MKTPAEKKRELVQYAAKFRDLTEGEAQRLASRLFWIEWGVCEARSCLRRNRRKKADRLLCLAEGFLDLALYVDRREVKP